MLLLLKQHTTRNTTGESPLKICNAFLMLTPLLQPMHGKHHPTTAVLWIRFCLVPDPFSQIFGHSLKTPCLHRFLQLTTTPDAASRQGEGRVRAEASPSITAGTRQCSVTPRSHLLCAGCWDWMGTQSFLYPAASSDGKQANNQNWVLDYSVFRKTWRSLLLLFLPSNHLQHRFLLKQRAVMHLL